MYHRNRGINRFLLSLIGAVSAFILVFSPILSVPPAAYSEDTKSPALDSVGDINEDGEINVLDFILTKLIVLGQLPYNAAADIDQNGKVNWLDPAALIDLIFSKSSSPHNGGGGGGGGDGGPTPTPAPAPTVTSISPAFGPTTGGTAVTITGTGFVTSATVTIGGNASTGVSVVNATSITATTPAGTAGARDVVVTNPDAQSGTLPGGFTYEAVPAPTVTSISPASGPTTGGTGVTITGTGFVTGATVTIGGTLTTGVTTVVNATSITATTPAGTAGARDVVVTNTDAQSGTLMNGFTYSSSCTPPNAITNLSVMSEDLGGIQWNAIRLTWTAPTGGPADSYEVRRSASAITNDTQWNASTNCSNIAYANGGTPRTPGQTETCTVKGLTENTSYFFAIKSTKGGCSSAVSTTSPSATAQQPKHEVGDWWMYKVYYNSEDGTVNTIYQINNVRATGQPTTVLWNNSTGARTVTNATIIDWNVPDEVGRSRYRKVAAPLVGSAMNMHIDNEEYVGAYDTTAAVRINPLIWLDPNPGWGAFSDPITSQYYFHGPDADYNANNIGYPYTLNETWTQHDYIYTDSGAIALRYQRWIYNWNWQIASSVTNNYNVSSPTTCPDVQGFSHDGGAGLYTVYNNSYTFTSGSGLPADPSGPVRWYYSPAAHSFVRKFDRAHYFGREDWVIQAYEIEDFGTSNLVVGNKSGNVSVSIDITNTTDEAKRFNVLCLIMDTNPANPGTHVAYKNGETVYPNFKSPGTSWPFFPAIQQTNLLQPGETQTVTWPTTYNCSGIGGNWTVWCSGNTSSWSN